jgi:hypothetical protein
MPSGLAAQLRHDTTDLHRQAERAGVRRDAALLIAEARAAFAANIRIFEAVGSPA